MPTSSEDTAGQATPLLANLGQQSLLTLASLIANGVARIASSLVVGRIAGPASLGVFQSGLSGAQLAGLLGPAALGSAASAFIARVRANGDPGTLEAVQSHLLLRILQTTAPVVVVGSLVWCLLTGHGLSSAPAFAALCASFCLYSFTRGLLYGSGLVNRAAWWNIATSVLGVVVVGAGVVLGVTDGPLLALFSLSYFTFAAVNWRRGRPRVLRSSLGREIDRFTMFAVLGTLASAGFLDSTMVLASAVGKPDDVGHFGAAFALAVPASLIGATATLVLYPLLSSLHADRVRRTRTRVVDLCSRCLAVLVVSLFAALILLRAELVGVLWGPTYRQAATMLVPLLFALMLTTLAIPAVNALTTLSRRGVRQSALSSVVGMVVGAVAWLFLVPSVGIIGVAYGFLAGSLISSVAPFVLTWRATEQSWSRHSVELLLAISVLAALVYLQQAIGTGTGANAAMLVGFIALWLTVVHSDARVLLTTFGRSFSRR